MKADKITLAKLEVLDWSDSFPLQFNPSELSLGRSADWNVQPTDMNSKVGHPFFAGSSPDTLEFTLLIDETRYMKPDLADASGFAAMLVRAAASAATALQQKSLSVFSKKNSATIVGHLEQLHKLVQPTHNDTKAKTTRPPVLLFTWDEFTFLGVITELQTQVLVVDKSGKMKRATVTVSMVGEALSKGTSAADFFNLKFVEESKLDDLLFATKEGED